MMAELIAGIVDVFAHEPLTGNPLAVVETPEPLPDDVLRRIAREFNQAETTFVMPSDRADWKLRSFTASGAEVYGAGHNALGAWLWLGYGGHLGALDSPTVFQQEIGDAVLPITMERRGDRIHGRMRQAPLKVFPPLQALEDIAAALGLSADDLMSDPAPRAADTGAPHLMLRARDAKTVDRARPSADKLLPVLASADAEGCYLYAFDRAAPEKAYARFFNPTVGLWEDSATGTAAGPLTSYLGSVGLLGADNSLLVEQGTLMGRPSFLHVTLRPNAELSGSGVVVLRGTLRF